MRRLDIDPTSLLALRTDILEELRKKKQSVGIGRENPEPIRYITPSTYSGFKDSRGNFPSAIAAAKRLPFSVDDEGRIVPPKGGAAGAIAKAAREFDKGRSTVIGISTLDEYGRVVAAMERMSEGPQVRLVEHSITQRQWSGAVDQMANQTKWPYLHGNDERSRYHPGSWEAVNEVASGLAEKELRHSQPGSVITDHDFQIEETGQHIRGKSTDPDLQGRTLVLFSHTPQPKPDQFAKMPHAKQVAKARLAYDSWGLQTPRDLEHAVEYYKESFPDAQITATRDGHVQVALGENEVDLFVAPIGVDVEALRQQSKSSVVRGKAKIIRDRHHGQVILSSLFRIDDPTKMGDREIEGFREALEQYPELKGRSVLIIAGQTSRDHLKPYHEQVGRVRAAVAEINRDFGTEDWAPVELIDGGVTGADRDALLLATDLCIDPAKIQGMGLVPQEHWVVRGYGGLQIAGDGVGSNFLMPGNITFNPDHNSSLSDAIVEAVTMSERERWDRHDTNSAVLRNPTQVWGEEILRAAARARERRNLRR